VYVTSERCAHILYIYINIYSRITAERCTSPLRGMQRERLCECEQGMEVLHYARYGLHQSTPLVFICTLHTGNLHTGTLDSSIDMQIPHCVCVHACACMHVCVRACVQG
jgi:hypothetical protein